MKIMKITDFEKIDEMLEQLFEHGDEMNVKARCEVVPAHCKFEDCFEANDFVKNEFADREIALNYWNVEHLCKRYCELSKYYAQLDKELEDPDY